MPEVGRGHRQRAEPREDDELDVVVVGGDVEHEPLLDEQRQGMHGARQRGRRCCRQCAGVAGRQDDDAVGAERHGVADRRVVGDATVEERAAVELDWRKHRGDGGRRHHRPRRVARGQQDVAAGEDLGGDHVDRDCRVLSRP